MKLICNHNSCNERDVCNHSVPHEEIFCTKNYCPIIYRQSNIDVFCDKVEIGFDPEEIISKAFKQGV